MSQGQETELRRVLIADDDRISRAMLRRALETDYAVDEAGDGLEALALLKEERYALLLLDIVMPRLNGWGLLAAMADAGMLLHTPVIVLTADNHPDSEIKALNLGASDVIVKPFVRVTLLSRMRNIIGRQEALRIAEQNRMYEYRLRQQEKLLRITEFDALTGLFNRKTFVVRAGEAIREKPASSFVMLCLDIEGFKVVNDRFGHSEGDKLLQYTARKMRGEIERMGGGMACHDVADVFLGLSPNDPVQLKASLARCEEYIEAYDLPQRVRVRFGLYVVDDPTLDVNLMIDRAVMAQRSIKGRANQIAAYYDGKIRDVIIGEQELASEMRDALRDGQFVLYFQPQFDYLDRRLIGAEALVRWQHPTKGLIPPGRFIPLFERNGFITELDQYVWRQSCRYIRHWLDVYGKLLPLTVSVNISRINLYDPKLIEHLVELIREYDLSPGMLRLEITESHFMDDPETLIRVVTKMRELGFYVEMDDFGSGFSSLNTLKDVPVDMIKMDMKFLSAENAGGRSGVILTSIVRMAHWLSVAVIAEGVETERQAEYLKSIGCSLMQGYYLSPPMPPDAFENLLERSEIGGLEKSKFFESFLDNEDFFDPNAQSTVIFSSFVGAAAIFEYQDGVAQAVRMNDRFFAVLGATRETFAWADGNLLDAVLPADREMVRRCMDDAAETGAATTFEARWRTEDVGQTLWLRVRLQRIARGGGRCAIYAAVEDVTDRRLANERLRVSEEEYRVVAAQSGKLILRYILSEDEASAAGGAAALFGFAEKQSGFTRAALERAVLPESAPAFEKLFARMRAGEPTGTCDLHLLSPDGASRWYQADYTLIGVTDDMPAHAILSFQDCSDRVAQEQAYRKWQEALTAMVAERCIVYVEFNLSQNRMERQEGLLEYAAGECPPCALEDVIRTSIRMKLVFADDEQTYKEFFRRERLLELFASDVTEDSIEYRDCRGDAPCWVRASVQMVRSLDSEDVKAFIVFTDIDRQRREMERLADAASRDAMTGLLNREATRSRIRTALSEAKPTDSFALLMIDMDNFKLVNDRFGHRQGDDALERAARAIAEAFRASDVVGRVGGDEFMVFLGPRATPALARAKAEALVNGLSFVMGGVTLTASVGAALTQGGAASFEQLYECADRALYEAKRRGRNGCVIYDTAGGAVGVQDADVPVSETVQLKTLLQYMDGGICIAEMEAGEIRIIYTSPSYFRALPQPPDVAGEECPQPLETVMPEDLPGLMARLREAAESDTPCDHAYRVQPDGKQWRMLRVVRMPGGRNGKTLLLGVITDITALKRAEAREEERAYRRALDRYANVLASVYDEVYEIDYARGVVALRFTRLFRAPINDSEHPLPEMISRWLTFNVLPSDRDRVRTWFEQGVPAEETRARQVTYGWVAMDGRAFRMEAALLRVDEGSALLCNRTLPAERDG